MYRRPWYVRLSRHHGSTIKKLFTAATAALLFSMMPLALLLHLGNTDVSGHAGRVPACQSTSSLNLHEQQAPDPGSIASGADPEHICRGEYGQE